MTQRIAEDEIALLPCPLCGGKHDQWLSAHGFGRLSVQCPHCGATTGQKLGQQAAIAAWNTRPIENQQRAEIEGLREKQTEKIKEAAKFGYVEGFKAALTTLQDCLPAVEKMQKDPAP